MNLTIVRGKISNNPEKQSFASEKFVTKFGLAVPRSYDREKVDFYNVQAWNKVGQTILNHLAKGDEIICTGEMQSNRTEDGKVFWNLVLTKPVEFIKVKKFSKNVEANESNSSLEETGFTSFDDLSRVAEQAFGTDN